ncbi:o-succinylbenzoate synthase [Streptomyces sp. enrichment culture]
MKITRIDLFQANLPYSGGVYQLSKGRTYTSFDATFVRITCDDGTQGWGESTPFSTTYVAAHARGVRAGVEEIAPQLLGRDPRQTNRINDVMDEALLGHPHTKTALDIACWDAFGKSVGLPVCELLGGSTNTGMPMMSSIHAGDLEDMRQRVAEYRARGYRSHSIKIGASERRADRHSTPSGSPPASPTAAAASSSSSTPTAGCWRSPRCACSGSSRTASTSLWKHRARLGGRPCRCGTTARTR